jgi:outer membrane protein
VIKHSGRRSASIRFCGLVLALSTCCPLFAQQPEVPPPYYDYPFANATTSARTLSLEDAVSLALGYAATYRQTTFDEKVAAEDVRQAKAAFKPTFSAPLTYFGTTPSAVVTPGEPRTFSFVASSAINETSAYFNAAGTLDIAGHLRASLRKSRALLASAHAGSQAARRSLVLATVDAYYGTMLAQQKRRLADETLSIAEGVASASADLLAQGKVEANEVDRARAAALAQRDALEQARLSEFAAMNDLHNLTGVDLSVHLIVGGITRQTPAANFIDLGPQSFLARPELAQIDAERNAARADAGIARAELRPQITYSFNGGFDAASLGRLRQYSGGSLLFSVNVPIFNFGASRSRQRQAELRDAALEVQRQNLEKQLSTEFYGARAAMNSASQRMVYTRDAAVISQRNLGAVFGNYLQQKATLLEVNDAQGAFAAARLAYYQAIADYYTARYRLDADPLATLTASSAGPPVITPNNAPHVSDTNFAPCTDGPDAAPEIGGVRLGMTEAELRAIFPKLPTPIPAANGIARTSLSFAELGAAAQAQPIFREAARLTFEFYQGKLSYVRVEWPETGRWNGENEFISHVAGLLEVSGRWKAFYDWNDKIIRDAEDLRDMAVECTGYRLSAGVGIEGLGGEQTPHLELEDLVVVRALKGKGAGSQGPGAGGK